MASPLANMWLYIVLCYFHHPIRASASHGMEGSDNRLLLNVYSGQLCFIIRLSSFLGTWVKNNGTGEFSTNIYVGSEG